MDNASKALIMAGGIIIGVLTLTVLIYGYMNINRMKNAEIQSKEIEQLTFFNRSYESYNRKLLRGTEIISVMNKAMDNNIKYENENYYKVTIEYEINGSTYDMVYYWNNVRNNQTRFDDLKTRIFDCIKLTYGNNSGRVNYMKFVERTT